MGGGAAVPVPGTRMRCGMLLATPLRAADARRGGGWLRATRGRRARESRGPVQPWRMEEEALLKEAMAEVAVAGQPMTGPAWAAIAERFRGRRSEQAIKQRWDVINGKRKGGKALEAPAPAGAPLVAVAEEGEGAARTQYLSAAEVVELAAAEGLPLIRSCDNATGFEGVSRSLAGALPFRRARAPPFCAASLCGVPVAPSRSLPLSVARMHAHTRTHAHTAHALALASRSLALSLSRSLALSHSRTLALSRSRAEMTKQGKT